MKNFEAAIICGDRQQGIWKGVMVVITFVYLFIYLFQNTAGQLAEAGGAIHIKEIYKDGIIHVMVQTRTNTEQ